MLKIREIVASDVETIAQLHATSWQDSYRGILRDRYLDGPIFEERLAVWHQRLLNPTPGDIGVIALSDSNPVGFTFACLSQEARWGTFLDNLHVTPQARGQGIGKQLVGTLTQALIAQGREDGIYLWVFEANHRARKFYERLGAQAIERVVAEAPGGGQVAEWRYAWASVLDLNTAAQ